MSQFGKPPLIWRRRLPISFLREKARVFSSAGGSFQISRFRSSIGRQTPGALEKDLPPFVSQQPVLYRLYGRRNMNPHAKGDFDGGWGSEVEQWGLLSGQGRGRGKGAPDAAIFIC